MKKNFLLIALIFFLAAPAEAADEDLPFDTLFFTVSSDENSILALIRMKNDGAVCFMVMDRNIEPVGLVPYTRKTYDFYLDKDSPLIAVMGFPQQQRGQVDDDLGEWDESFHIVPFYVNFDVQGGQVVCEKPFSSAHGLNPSHYHGTIKNTDYARLIEILMKLMPQLHQVADSKNISLP